MMEYVPSHCSLLTVTVAALSTMDAEAEAMIDCIYCIYIKYIRTCVAAHAGTPQRKKHPKSLLLKPLLLMTNFGILTCLTAYLTIVKGYTHCAISV